ncbi:DNA-processing protein DprA [Tumebacillus permanentifrigoris]|uniref:DNA protecting protein DprA n=1 Tax=Tumebacillus permanentifrigoris TaxID=378543 RepID=A0A316DC12_9BACL|nr:DNA-processing protein DprA [Tumebacillus permanentifrigoris]PWK12725.1 DNA protecting protein DprA [Tumebacillus permanentifrigoris]
MREQEILLWLSTTQGVGSLSARALQDYFGDWRAVWAADPQEMVRGAGLRKNIATALAKSRASFDPVAIRRQFEPEGIRFLSVLDPAYPASLHTIYDPPVGLFLYGDLPPTGDNGLAVVGSRTPTSYGTTVAKKLVGELAAHGLTIVSGFARGIDTVAHRAALAAGGQTVAVLGSGLLKLYPRENTPLARAIAEGHGCLLSEHHPLMDALPGNFPARNRLISALSRAVLVIEAGERSGSLITADLALEQGRDVYAIPGMITSTQSDGTNRLIQQGAKLIRTAQDILEDYHLTAVSVSSRETPTDLTPEARHILQILGPFERHLDELLASTGFSAGLLHAHLLRLQLLGLITARPGGRYISNAPS